MEKDRNNRHQKPKLFCPPDPPQTVIEISRHPRYGKPRLYDPGARYGNLCETLFSRIWNKEVLRDGLIGAYHVLLHWGTAKESVKGEYARYLNYQIMEALADEKEGDNSGY